MRRICYLSGSIWRTETNPQASLDCDAHHHRPVPFKPAERDGGGNIGHIGCRPHVHVNNTWKLPQRAPLCHGRPPPGRRKIKMVVFSLPFANSFPGFFPPHDQQLAWDPMRKGMATNIFSTDSRKIQVSAVGHQPSTRQRGSCRTLTVARVLCFYCHHVEEVHVGERRKQCQSMQHVR